jgi:hypothetical protein
VKASPQTVKLSGVKVPGRKLQVTPTTSAARTSTREARDTRARFDPPLTASAESGTFGHIEDPA